MGFFMGRGSLAADHTARKSPTVKWISAAHCLDFLPLEFVGKKTKGEKKRKKTNSALFK